LECTRDVLVKLNRILKGDDNYLTFTIGTLSLLVAIAIYLLQKRKSELDRKRNETTQNVDKIGQLLDSLEGRAVQFWMGAPNGAGPQPDHAELVQLGIIIKSVTTAARKVVELTKDSTKPISYPGNEFTLMRQAVTLDGDLHLRPMNLNSLRIQMIQNSCQALRTHFTLAPDS